MVSLKSVYEKKYLSLIQIRVINSLSAIHLLGFENLKGVIS